MRTVRWIASGLALVAMMPAPGAAQQQSRLFENAWFWGAKLGIVNFSTSAAGSATAPAVGGEWLITRSRGGLYLAAEQAFFDEVAQVFDNTGTPYQVAIRDMRRYTAAAMAFPVVWNGVRPYAGAGFSLNLIQGVGLIDPPTDPDQFEVVAERVQDQKDRISFILMGGAQWQWRRFSLFGQATYMPARANFLLDDRSTYILEAGLRYNVGRSTERAR